MKRASSPEHSTGSIKGVTGKTAGDWIEDTVVLEAEPLNSCPFSAAFKTNFTFLNSQSYK